MLHLVRQRRVLRKGSHSRWSNPKFTGRALGGQRKSYSFDPLFPPAGVAVSQASALRPRRIHLRTNALLWATAAVLTFVGLVQTAQAQAARADVPTVAVLDFTGLMLGSAGNSAPLGKAVSSMLITELLGNPGLQVIERYQLQDILMEQKLALSGRVDESTAVEIGKMVGAQYMIYGQVTSIAEQLRMDMRVVDVETSKVLAAQKMNDKTSELLSVVVYMAESFMKELDLKAPSSRSDREPIPVGATIEFSRAVDFEDKGDVDKALEHYRKVLELHPSHRAAQQAVDRLGTSKEGDR